MSKINVIEIIQKMKEMYPDAKCSLDFTTPFEIAIAVILSAQCTDERVNKVTPGIFDKYNTPKDFANLSLEKIEEMIHSCGFYRNKAKNIKNLSIELLEKYNGEIPNDMEKLIKLSGIGRKSANVIMLEAFSNPVGIAVDTHCGRIARRIGLSKNNDPNKVEQDLLKIIPKEYLKDVNHLFVWHGRYTCTSGSPKCDKCGIKKHCEYFNDNFK